MQQILKFKFEIYRKVFHFCLILLPISYVIVKNKKIFFISLFVATFIIVLADFFRHKNNILNSLFLVIFGKIMRDHEKNQPKLSGLSYTFLSASVVFALAKPVVAIMSLFILAIADGFASIIGKLIKSRPFYQKTLAGSITFFCLAALVVAVYGWYFQYKSWSFYVYSLIAVIFATTLEARSDLLKLDDNLIVPLSFALILSFFDILWNFL
jgi:dolichol kinase